MTANLPSRDFAATIAFYKPLGFGVVYSADNWLILQRAGEWVEFFPYPDLDPFSSSFSACLRVSDPDALLAAWRTVGLPERPDSIPRLSDFFTPPGAPRMFALVDQDGTLWRCMGVEDESRESD